MSSLQIERIGELILPSNLDGSLGSNRVKDKPSYLRVTTDIEAINCWLEEYRKSEETFRNYQKEAERFLLWAVIARQKPLSSLESDDLLAYSKFLDNPQPAEIWCGPKKAKNGKRYSAGWKPFVGSLSPSTKVATFSVLNSLFNFLVDGQYLIHNPMRIIKRQIKHKRMPEENAWKIKERIIDFEQFDAMLNVIEKFPDTTLKETYLKTRLFFMVVTLYKSGLRVSELKKHGMSDFKKEWDYEYQKLRWWLFVVGKGNKLRKIPVDEEWLEALAAYRRIRNLPDLPEEAENEPLMDTLTTGMSMSDRRINQLLKLIAHEAAKQFEFTQPEKAKQLKKISAHWLRHYSCTVQGIVGIERIHTKTNLGHSKIETLNVYDHSLDNLRHAQAYKLKLRPEKLVKN